MNILTLSDVALEDSNILIPIENACHSHPWSEKTLRSCIGGRYFGEKLSEEKNVLGFYVGEYIAGEATLMDICVDPTYQGKGYGKKLLNAFLDRCKQKNTVSVFLEVRASNTAAHLMYINSGFIEVARRTGYYPSEQGYEDAIVMKLTF